MATMTMSSGGESEKGQVSENQRDPKSRSGDQNHWQDLGFQLWQGVVSVWAGVFPYRHAIHHNPTTARLFTVRTGSYAQKCLIRRNG